MARKKSLIDKAIEGVDHFIHPDHSHDELDSQVEKVSTEKSPRNQTINKKDIQFHAKFAKFKQEKN